MFARAVWLAETATHPCDDRVSRKDRAAGLCTLCRVESDM